MSIEKTIREQNISGLLVRYGNDPRVSYGLGSYVVLDEDAGMNADWRLVNVDMGSGDRAITLMPIEGVENGAVIVVSRVLGDPGAVLTVSRNSVDINSIEQLYDDIIVPEHAELVLQRIANTWRIIGALPFGIGGSVGVLATTPVDTHADLSAQVAGFSINPAAAPGTQFFDGNFVQSVPSPVGATSFNAGAGEYTILNATGAGRYRLVATASVVPQGPTDPQTVGLYLLVNGAVLPGGAGWGQAEGATGEALQLCVESSIGLSAADVVAMAFTSDANGDTIDVDQASLHLTRI